MRHAGADTYFSPMFFTKNVTYCTVLYCTVLWAFGVVKQTLLFFILNRASFIISI
jgi:hypothetical protein